VTYLIGRKANETGTKEKQFETLLSADLEV
jgi:hypothetical protein